MNQNIIACFGPSCLSLTVCLRFIRHIQKIFLPAWLQLSVAARVAQVRFLPSPYYFLTAYLLVKMSCAATETGGKSEGFAFKI